MRKAMSPHVLLVVNSYVTDRDPRRGAKFRLQLESYARSGWKVGLVAVFQRDYTLRDCVRAGGIVVEEQAYGVPIIRDCTYYSLLKVMPGAQSALLGARLAAKSVERYIRKHGRPDIIHAHGSQWSGIVANRVYRAHGIPYVLTEHMTNYSQGRVSANLLPLLREVFAGARMRLPISKPLGDRLDDLFQTDFRPWTVVPNMLEESLFELPQRTDEAEPGFTFLTLSQLAPKKGLGVLLRAFARAFKGHAVRLRIGGDGDERGKLEKLVEDLGIRNQVVFLGYIPRAEVAEELRKTKAYVLSSEYETFGIPVIEAHAAGKPVISTRCGGPETLINESNGILVPPGDVDALASAMKEVVSRINDFDSAAIARMCKDRFSPSAVLAQLKEVYDAALQNAS